MKEKYYKIYALLLGVLVTLPSLAQVDTFTYPTGPGEAVLSDKYEVWVSHADGEEQKLQVLMSNAKHIGDFKSDELEGRTFSFVHVDYDFINGSGMTFRVKKIFGDDAKNVEVQPKSYGITPTQINANEITFTQNQANKYMSINFKGSDNLTPQHGWIKHMLCIFVDPKENNAPNKNGSGVVVYNPNVPSNALANASVIYFEPGFYDLKDYNGASGTINNAGVITLTNNQKVYIAGGAFVEGIVRRTNYSDSNQAVYGRGILSGRDYLWRGNPASGGVITQGEMIELGQNAFIEGVMVMESPHHGIVGRNVNIKNLKFLGWHANNDAIRVGSCEIEDSFIRAVDDHFYNFNINVHDCVLWAGHNGAIITYGWGGEQGSNTYNSGSSILEDIDIIHPEWLGLGNNNGLVAAQTGLDYAPHGYGSSTLTVLRDIRVDGDIPGLVNLKPRSSGGQNITAVPVPEASLGYLGDLLMEEIRVDGQFGKSLIHGKVNATTNGNSVYYVQNVEFTDIIIGGVPLTEDTKKVFFDIHEPTTRDIRFDAGTGVTGTPTELITFDDVTLSQSLTAGEGNFDITKADLEGIQDGRGQWFTRSTNGTVDFKTVASGGNPGRFLARNTNNEFAKGIVYVFKNTDASASGLLKLGFDYRYASSLDADRMAFQIYGIQDDEGDGIDGSHKLDGGSGAFGDNFASTYDGADGTLLASNLALPQTDDWATVEAEVLVTGYEYITIAFANAFNANPTEDLETLFSVDNVIVPKNATLSLNDARTTTFGIYPNPATDKVRLLRVGENYSYTIYNLLGMKMGGMEHTAQPEIDLSYLAAGTYLIKIDNGFKTETHKFIKR